jgi:topoisomerase-4 subunit B
VRVWPDAKYFESPQMPHGRAGAPAAQQGRADARRDGAADRREKADTQTWQFKGGLRDYLAEPAADAVIPLFEGEGYAGKDDSFAEGEGALGAGLHRGRPPVRESYVNLIPTTAGGTHDSGLRDGLFQAVKGFIELHRCCPRASS